MAIVLISQRTSGDIQRLAVQEDLISEIVARNDTLGGMSYLVRMNNGNAFSIDELDATPELVRLSQGAYKGG